MAVVVCPGLMLTACTSSGSTGDTNPPTVVSLSDTAYPPNIQCLIDAGATVHSVTTSPYTGNPAYHLELPQLDPERLGELVERCEKLSPPIPKPTDEELREIYEMWLDEAACLVELGYEPDPAPPFEVFLSRWYGGSPWMPIDGIDISGWTPEKAAEVKEACGLEFFDSE